MQEARLTVMPSDLARGRGVLQACALAGLADPEASQPLEGALGFARNESSQKPDRFMQSSWSFMDSSMACCSCFSILSVGWLSTLCFPVGRLPDATCGARLAAQAADPPPPREALLLRICTE